MKAIGTQATMQCQTCGEELPIEAFEQYATGTRRRVCRRCKYWLYGIKAKRKWRLQQLARACTLKVKGMVKSEKSA